MTTATASSEGRHPRDVGDRQGADRYRAGPDHPPRSRRELLSLGFDPASRIPLAAGSETMLLFALVEMPEKRATRLGKCAELCSLFRAS